MHTPRSSPVVSIIIVTLNAEDYIERCLNSIANITWKDIEIVVFDGGSTDRTCEILNRYQKVISYWQSSPDSGIFDAMNKSIEKTNGSWLYFLGADDQLLEGFSDMVSRLSHHKTIYYGDISYDGVPTFRKKYSAYRLSKESICHQAIFYPREAFLYHRYNTKYKISADWDLNIRLWGDKRFKFQYLPILVANYSMNGVSSREKDCQLLNDLPQIIRENLGVWVKLRRLVKSLKVRKSLL